MDRHISDTFFIHLLPAICAICRPWEGLVIGSIGGLIACAGCQLTEKLRIDDPVGVVPVHMMCGIWGLTAVGLFGDKDHLDDLNSMDGKWKLLLINSKLFVVAIASGGYLNLSWVRGCGPKLRPSPYS